MHHDPPDVAQVGGLFFYDIIRHTCQILLVSKVSQDIKGNNCGSVGTRFHRVVGAIFIVPSSS